MASDPTPKKQKSSYKRKTNRKPNWDNGRPPPPPPRAGARVDLRPQALADAAFDFLSLLVRVARSPDRGPRAVEESTRKRLLAFMGFLYRQRGLSPQQIALGKLRLNFDEICRFAATLEASAERDCVLASALSERCVREPVFFPEGFDARIALQAMDRVRSKGVAANKGDNKPSRDWLKAPGSSPHAGKTSGLILAEIMAAYGLQAPSSSEHSTRNYARAVKEAGLTGLLAKTVYPAETITYLATAFGVPLEVAPVVALKIANLIQDHLPRSEPGAADLASAMDFYSSLPSVPAEIRPDKRLPGNRVSPLFPVQAKRYSYLEKNQWEQLIDPVKKEFTDRGFLAESDADMLPLAWCLTALAPVDVPQEAVEDLERCDPQHVAPQTYWESATPLFRPNK